MATYTQRPDYKSYEFNPYQMDVKGIAGAINARTNMWLNSASVLKSTYDKSAAMALTHESSKEKLRNYLSAAEEEIQKSLKTDISISSNAQAALDVFKPIYQDRQLTLDNQITEFYQEQNRLAENFKTVDGGKKYSVLNHAYTNKKYAQFAQDLNPENWENHYNNRKGYVPYYDYRKDMSEIYKNCKPDEQSYNSASGLYFKNTDISSLTSLNLNACLSAGLPEQAKQQIYIEGYMNSGDDYQGVASRYLEYSASNSAALSKELEALEGSISGLIDKKNKGTITEAELNLLDSRLTDREAKKLRLEDLNSTSKAIASGDLKFIQDNFESLSGTLHFRQLVNDYADAFSYSKESVKIEENNAAMLALRLQHEATMSNIEFTQDMVLQDKKAQDDLKLELLKNNNSGSKSSLSGMKRVVNPDGSVSMVPDYPDVPFFNPTNTVANQTYSTVEQNIVTSKEVLKGANQWLFESIKRDFPYYAGQYSSAEDFIGSAGFQNFVKSNPENPILKEWLNSTSAARESLQLNSDILSIAREQAKIDSAGTIKSYEEVSRGIDTKYLQNYTARLANGTTILTNFKSIYNSIVNKDGGYTLAKDSDGQKKLFWKGQLVDLGNGDNTAAALHPLRSLLESDIFDQVNTSYSTALQRNLHYQYTTSQGWKDISVDNVPNNTLRSRIAANLNLSNKDADSRIFLKASDLKGNVEFTVLPKEDKDNPDNTELSSEDKKNLKNMGAELVEGNTYRIGKVNEYSVVNPNSAYTKKQISIDMRVRAEEGKLNQGLPVEIPLRSKSDDMYGTPYASYKLTVRTGPIKGTKVYQLNKKDEDGIYKPLQIQISSPQEALKFVENFDGK